MKIAYSLSALGMAHGSITRDRRDGDRRYNQLEEMALKWFEYNGGDWNDKNYWSYGCHCFMLNDRPMSEMGVGKPVDKIDHICKKWKFCQKCVRDNHGEDCIGEAHAYQTKWNVKNEEWRITNDAGTCEREIGECDWQFVKDMWTHHTVYNPDYNVFKGFDREDPDNCVITTGTHGGGGGGGGGNGGSGTGGGDSGVDPTEIPDSGFECCGGHNRAWEWISTDTHQCCPLGNSGVSKPYGELC